MDSVEATVFLNSTILISEILNHVQGGKRPGTCEQKIKKMFVTDDDRSVSQFAAVACHLSSDDVVSLLEVLQLNTNVKGILDTAGGVADHVAAYSLWSILDDISYFERMVIDLESIGGQVNYFDENPIFYLDLWIPELTDCIESMQDKEAEQGDWAM